MNSEQPCISNFPSHLLTSPVKNQECSTLAQLPVVMSPLDPNYSNKKAIYRDPKESTKFERRSVLDEEIELNPKKECLKRPLEMISQTNDE